MSNKTRNTEILSLLNLLIKIAKEDKSMPEYFTLLLEFLKQKYKTSAYDT